jgi:OmpA-OmpF porin, OOP family
MHKLLARSFLIASAVTTFAAAPIFAAPQEIQGIIVNHVGGQITVKTIHGNQSIPLAPHVRIRQVSGVFGANKEQQPIGVLIPGLPVTVKANDSSGHLVAEEIDFKKSEHKTARQVQAGVEETKRQAEETARREAELRSAYMKLGEWDVKLEKNVYFKTGSAVISAQGKQTLGEVAREAPKHKGYVVSVLGYADPRGTAKANERLSNRRAQAVINYLKQSGHLQPGRVLSASAMGEVYLKAAEAADEQAHANSRRVTVRVVTSAAHLKP